MTESPNDPLSPRKRVSTPRIQAASIFGARSPALSRKLRQEATEAESILWRYLRNKHLAGLKFLRQQALGPCIVDFLCLEQGLVVEVDGGQHFETTQEKLDIARTTWLESRGLRVSRSTNLEVLIETETVVEHILSEVARHTLAPALSLREREPPSADCSPRRN